MNVIAKGQGYILKEIEKSKSQVLKDIQVPKNIPGIRFLYIGDFDIHHMDSEEKHFLDGTMSKKDFKEMVKKISEGKEDEDLIKFKKELDSIILIPAWFHRFFKSKSNELAKRCNSRTQFYEEMSNILRNEFETIKALQLVGDDVRDWLKSIYHLKNTIYVKPDDYEKIKGLLKEVYEIIKNNINDAPEVMKTASVGRKIIARKLIRIAKSLLAADSTVKPSQNLCQAWDAMVLFDANTKELKRLFDRCVKATEKEYQEKIAPVFKTKYKTFPKDKFWDDIFEELLKSDDLGAFQRKSKEKESAIFRYYQGTLGIYKNIYLQFCKTSDDLFNSLQEVQTSVNADKIGNVESIANELNGFISKEFQNNQKALVKGDINSSFKTITAVDLDSFLSMPKSAKIYSDTAKTFTEDAIRKNLSAKKKLEETIKRFAKIQPEWKDLFDWSVFYLI